MMTPEPTLTAPDESLDPALAPLVEELTARLQAGEPVDTDAYCHAHPEHADRLRRLLPALRLLAGASAAGRAAPPNGAALPDVLGDYRLVREVGRGGMGVVYEAVQESLGRRVAVKVLPHATLADDRQLQRFKNEARAAASLRHPHIVPVHGVGCDHGVHYFAMMFVEGTTLADAIRDLRSARTPTLDQTTVDGPPAAAPAAAPPADWTGRPDTAHLRRSARLIAQAADALECAHATGVVHRDIKPGNLMVDADRHLWVTDFGVARVGAADGVTVTGDLVGTLRYMSPEQALARHGLLDHRTDIYSLGVTLYELATLRPAADGMGREDILYAVTHQEPPRPRRLNRAVPADLETVILKAMAKEPADRYPTAAAFADDLRRWLDDRPVQARPESRGRRAVRWVRRRPTLAAAYGLAAAVLVLAAASGGATWLWQRAEGAAARERQARGELADSERRVRQVSYLHAVALADRAYQGDELLRARLLLAGVEPELRGWEWQYLDRLCRPEVASLTHGRALFQVLFSPDGRQLWSESSDGPFSLRRETVRWDWAAGKQISREDGNDVFDQPVTSPDGKWTATADEVREETGTGRIGRLKDAVVSLREAATGQEVRLGGHRGAVQLIAFAPDSRQVAVLSYSGGVRVWDIATRKPVLDKVGHRGEAQGLFFSADGTRLTSIGTDGVVKEWDVATATEVSAVTLQELPADEKPDRKLSGLALSPDKLHGVGGVKTDIKMWELATGRVVRTFSGHTAPPNSILYLPGGKQLVSSSHDKTIRVWDAATGVEVRKLVGHAENVMVLALHPDGRHLASSSTDGTVKVWDLQKPPQTRVFQADRGLPAEVAFSPDGRRIAAAGDTGTVRVWNPRTGQPAAEFWAHPGQVSGLAFGPNGLLATGAWDRIVKLWDVPAGKLLRTFTGHAGGVTKVAVSPDGTRLASGSHDDTARVWDAATGAELARLDCGGTVYAVAFTPDGKRLVTAGNDAAVLWDIDTKTQAVTFPDPGGGLRAVDVSPDGSRLATTGNDRTAKLWDMAGGPPQLVLRGHTAWNLGVRFSPDGRRLATGSADSTVRLWDVATGQEALTLADNKQMVTGVAFSPDGTQLASACEDGSVRVWSAVDPAAAAEPPDPAPATFPPPPGFLATVTGPGTEMVRCLTGDAAGNTVVAGSFGPAARLGDLALSSGGDAKTSPATLFVAKLDPAGKVLWLVRPDAPTKRGNPHRVAVDAAGDVYLTGTYTGELPLGPPAPAKSDGLDTFLVKLRGGDGQALWMRSLGGPGPDHLSALAVGPDGVYVAGSFKSKTVSYFEKQRFEQGGPELTVQKFAPDGTPGWTRTVGGTMTLCAVRALAVDAAGDLYAAGSFDQTAAFPTGPLTAAGRDPVVAKLAGADGRWLWARSFPCPADGHVYGVAVAPGGPLYLTGGFGGTARFDGTSLTAAGPADGFVARLDPGTGAVAWAKAFGGAKLDHGSAVAVDAGGRVHVAGSYRGEAKFGPHTLDYGEDENGFVATLSPAGDFLAAVSFADEGTTAAVGGLHVDAGGNRYVGGHFSGTGEVGFPQRHVRPTAGSSEGYVVKLPAP